MSLAGVVRMYFDFSLFALMLGFELWVFPELSILGIGWWIGDLSNVPFIVMFQLVI